MMCIFLRVKNKGELSETKKIKYLLTGRVSLGGQYALLSKADCAVLFGVFCSILFPFLFFCFIHNSQIVSTLNSDKYHLPQRFEKWAINRHKSELSK